MVAQVSLASIMATISMVGKEQNYTTSGVLCARDAPLRLIRIISDTGAEVSRYAKIGKALSAVELQPSSICTIPTIEQILGGLPVVGDIGPVMASTQRR